MTLKDFIESLGPNEAARLFGVKRRTVDSWRRGERAPRPAKAKEIVNLTGGVVTLSDCYEVSEAT